MSVVYFVIGAVAGGVAAAVFLRRRHPTPAPPSVAALDIVPPAPPAAVQPSVPPGPPPPVPAARREVAAVEAAVGHVFADKEVLERALTHRSYIAEHQGTRSYERLEFLGDAVLQLAVTNYLFAEHGELAEGEMAKVRASVVSEPILARFADSFRIAPALRLGRGEEITGGREKPSLLSDVVESVIGALYLDAGFHRAEELVVERWADVIEERVTAPGKGDFKTRLQELAAQQGKRPEYRLTEAGPPHARTFVATVTVGGEILGSGEGTSKKRAQQAAARAAIARLA